MIRRLIALIAILAGLAGVVWFAPHFNFTVGEVPKAEVLKVKAQDLTLVCPGGVYRTGGASGTKVGLSSRLVRHRLTRVSMAPPEQLCRAARGS